MHLINSDEPGHRWATQTSKFLKHHKADFEVLRKIKKGSTSQQARSSTTSARMCTGSQGLIKWSTVTGQDRWWTAPRGLTLLMAPYHMINIASYSDSSLSRAPVSRSFSLSHPLLGHFWPGQNDVMWRYGTVSLLSQLVCDEKASSFSCKCATRATKCNKITYKVWLVRILSKSLMDRLRDLDRSHCIRTIRPPTAQSRPTLSILVE